MKKSDTLSQFPVPNPIYNASNKLTKLTDKESAYLEVTKDYWKDKFFSGAPIDREQAQKALNWIYKNKLDLPNPELCIVDSPQAVIFAANLFLNNKFTREQADECAMKANELSADPDGKEKLKSFCKPGTVKTYNPSNFLNVLDWGWVSYYSFFHDIGVDYEDAAEAFREFRQLLEANVYSTLLFDEVVVASRLPLEIHKNAENRPHNATGPAIRFADNFSIYYLNGISFGHTGNCDLILKLQAGEMTMTDILKISNVDQRTQAYRYADPDSFFREVNAVVLDTYSKKNNKTGEVINYSLVRIPQNNIFSETAYFMRYDCPSTGKQYISGVTEAKTVPQAMAWKFKTTEADWCALEPDITES